MSAPTLGSLPRTAVNGEDDRSSPFAERPVLVFWETTKACLLACQHCRARAQREPLPGELSTEEGEAFLRQIADFGRPSPVVVFTGGDLLMRADIFHLLDVAQALGLRSAIAPSATPLLTREALTQLFARDIHSLSLSLDGPKAVHDRIRGVSGTYEAVISQVRAARETGFTVQINTVVMRSTVAYLADVAALLLAEGVHVWEVFFLIATGRALADEYLEPDEWDDVCRFLLNATQYGLLVRTVEGPFVRRVLREDEPSAGGALYRRLSARLRDRLGAPVRTTQLARTGTLDGDGIIFVAHDGTISPGGFLPLPLGNVRQDHVVSVYRTAPLLRSIRARRFRGKCGVCPLRRVCGGSRARAYAATGDPLESDPACPYQPTS